MLRDGELRNPDNKQERFENFSAAGDYWVARVEALKSLLTADSKELAQRVAPRVIQYWSD